LEAQIIKHYHVIEKGLSMPDFRPRFGIPRVRSLISLMKNFKDSGGDSSNPHFGSAILCLEDYRNHHQQLGIDVDDVVWPDIRESMFGTTREFSGEIIGGIHSVSPEMLFNDADSPFEKFADSRKSCRNFDPNQAVPPMLVEQAVQIARRAPSVCNRQAWKVHSYHDRTTIDHLLSHQNGNVGFGHLIPCLLIVTMDLECFDGSIERYQPWIDGGMFGMMLLLALHHLRLGAVPLNWSVIPVSDKRLRKAGNLPNPESIVMLIGIGHPAGPTMMPISQRRQTGEILTVHNCEP
jgi:nitroreductase